MSYDTFLVEIEIRLQEFLGESHSVKMHYARKNNGRIRKGIMFKEVGVNVSPTIYMEEYYECYLENGNLEQIVDSILTMYEQIRMRKSWESTCIQQYEYVKDRIIYQLVNYESNRVLLEEIPYCRYKDFAIIFYVLVEKNLKTGNIATMLIRKEHLEWWKMEEEALYCLAHENTERLLPYEFAVMSAVIGELLEEEGIEYQPADDGLYVLTNDIRNFGAATLLYEQRLERIGEYLKENYYILPSSVHEVLIIPESKASSKYELTEIVKEVNETHVQPEEILSDHAYYYDCKRKELIP